MTLDQRVLLRLDVQRPTHVALVVPDHQITLQLTALHDTHALVTPDRARSPHSAILKSAISEVCKNRKENV